MTHPTSLARAKLALHSFGVPRGWCASLVLSACGLAPAVLAGCSGDFSSCRDDNTCEGEGDLSGERDHAGTGGVAVTRDSGSGSTGGSGGTGTNPPGGSGGSDPDGAPDTTASTGGSASSDGGTGGEPADHNECESNADCDDGLHCNGEETCDDGQCAAGTPTECENADPDHCAVACVEGNDEAECVVSALDSDDDGYASTACAPDPGLDCDDSNENVNPDAEEICDGIDNDCNGASDLGDGLPLAGTSNVISDALEVDVDWSPVTESFGLAVELDAIFFADLLETGELQPTVEVTTPAGSEALVSPRVAWGLDAWGIVYGRFIPNASDTQNFFRVSADGEAAGPAANNGSKTRPFNDIVWNDAGYWLAVRPTSESVVVDRIVPTQGGAEYATGATFQKVAEAPRIATSPNGSAVVWQLAESATLEWSVLGESLYPSEPQVLSDAGQLPRVATIPDGYTLTWATQSGFSFEARAADGSTLCGPTTVPFGDDVLDAGDEVAPVHTEHGTLVLAVDAGSGAVSLFRFDDNCEVEVETSVDSPVDVAWSPNLAIGNKTVALVWSGQTRGDEKENFGVYRVFGELLCE